MRARCARLFRYCCYCWGNNRPSIGCSGTMYLFRCGQRCSIDRQKSRDFSKLRAPPPIAAKTTIFAKREWDDKALFKPLLIQWGGVILMYSLSLSPSLSFHCMRAFKTPAPLNLKNTLKMFPHQYLHIATSIIIVNKLKFFSSPFSEQKKKKKKKLSFLRVKNWKIFYYNSK